MIPQSIWLTFIVGKEFVFVFVVAQYLCKDLSYLQFVFTSARVLFVLMEVVNEDPYSQEDQDAIWTQIANRVNDTLQAENPDVTQPKLSMRTLKDKIKAMVKMFKEEDWRNLKK